MAFGEVEVFDRRDDLIDAVRYGRMSPEEADAEALRAGLTPLSHQPDPADFDPVHEPFWTPAMTVAWIAWRTPDAVRRAWAPYCRECRFWRFQRWRVGQDGPTYDGYELQQAGVPAVEHLHYWEIDDLKQERRPHVSVGPAVEEFVSALRNGEVTATGVPLEAGGRVSLTPMQFLDISLDYMTNDWRFTPNASTGTGGFRDILVPTGEILKRWRPLPPPMPESLPQVVHPNGAGYMTVFHALLWIATNGGSDLFDPTDRARWQQAFDAFLPVLASGYVALTGEREGGREVVPPHVLAACRFEPPFGSTPAGLHFGGDLYLRSYPYVDEEHWRNGFDDALMVGLSEKWSRLMVPKEAVASRWPFALAVPYHTGAQGRPSSMRLVEREFERRARSGALEPSLAAEARALVGWLGEAHPDAPSLTTKTVENRLRGRYRAARRPEKIVRG